MYRWLPTSARAWQCRWIWLWIACCTISGTLQAQAPLILKRADSLFSLGEWQSALHEYKRFEWATKQLPNSAKHRKAFCHLSLGDAPSALKIWTSLNQSENVSPLLKDTCIFHSAVAAWMMNQYDESLAYLNWLSPPGEDSLNYMGATVMKAIVLNSAGKFRESKKAMQTLVGADQSMLTELDSLYKKPLRYDPKSVTGALVMSIVLPGSGQMYAGKPVDGLLSLVLTGGTGALGVYSFVQGHYFFTFLTCLLVFQKFYEGGARHAMRLVKQWNEKKRFGLTQALNDYLLENWSPVNHK